jgi:predicted small lipoprotein YifL
MKARILMVVLLVTGIGISACGKKGPLEPPKPSVSAVR